MSYKKLFLLFILLLIANVFANTINYKITTIYPTEEPYYKGTKINDIKIWITNKNNEIINPTAKELKIKIGSKEITLEKKNNFFYKKLNLIIDDSLISNNAIIIKIVTPINATPTIKKYQIKDISEYVEVKDNLKNIYNLKQTINLKLNFNFLKDSDNLECKLIYPILKDKKFICSNNSCEKNFIINNDINTIKIFCTFLNNERFLPIYITKNIKINKHLNFELLNPKEGIVYNPFQISFFIKYPNNDNLEDYTDIKVYLNGKEKNYSLDKKSININYLLLPYTTLNKTLTIEYRDINYNFVIHEKLFPTTWFWLVLGILIAIFSFNIIFLIYKLFKKEDLEELIRKRDYLQKQLEIIKEQYMKGLLTKARYDALNEDYHLEIENLNKKILKLKSKENIKEKQLKEISKIKETKIENKKLNPDDILKKLNPKKEIKIVETDKKTFINKILKKEEKQTTTNKKIDVNKWLKE